MYSLLSSGLPRSIPHAALIDNAGDNEPVAR